METTTTDNLTIGERVTMTDITGDVPRRITGIRDGLAGGWRYVDLDGAPTRHVTASQVWTIH